jgi:hypothetical protein
MSTEAIGGTIAGLVAGGIYFWLQESSIPRESNAQYLAPWTTDLLAWVGGSVLIAQGFKHNDGAVTFIGAAIASTHVAQFAAHKVIQNRLLGQKDVP